MPVGPSTATSVGHTTVAQHVVAFGSPPPKKSLGVVGVGGCTWSPPWWDISQQHMVFYLTQQIEGGRPSLRCIAKGNRIFLASVPAMGVGV